MLDRRLFLAAALLLAAVPARADGPAFSGVRHDGKVVTEADLTGWRLYFFGYTHCPDVCPTSMVTISDMLTKTPALADRLTPVFFTVDPERDTPQVLSEYVTAFHPRLVGISPSPDGLAAQAKAYRIKFARVAHPSGGDYLMDHTASLILVGPDGREMGRLPHDLDAARLGEKIAEVMARSGG